MVHSPYTLHSSNLHRPKENFVRHQIPTLPFKNPDLEKMSSDIFVLDESLHYYHQQQSSNPIAMLDSDTLFLCDSSIDSIFQEITGEPNTISTIEAQKNLPQISADKALSLEQIAQTLLSDSSPSNQMESLSVYKLQNSSDLLNFHVSDIKLEEPLIPVGFESPPSSNAFFSGSHSYGGSGGESLMMKFLQRSYSYGGAGYSYDEEKQGTLFQPAFGAVFESPESGGQIRRVSSTGDLSKVRIKQATSQSVLGGESSSTTYMEETNFKVGRYSAQERKERIDRYKAKRTQRNFNKTIKYACRKTLADNRLRIRGRFARNDEPGETSKTGSCLNRYEDEDEFWVEGRQEEGEDGEEKGHFMDHFGGSCEFEEYGNIGYS